MHAPDPAHGRYALPDGRVVYLTRLLLAPTYEGALEGSLESLSQIIRGRLERDVPRALGSNAPLVVLDDGAARLPAHRWAAAFQSLRGVRQAADPDYASRLALCWFTAAIPADLHAMVAAALAAVDWDAHAEDYSIIDG